MMIRPFDLRDVPLVAQLENLGTSLDAELALTQKTRALPSALTAFLSLNSHGPRTYVCRSHHGERLIGLAQMHPRRGTTRGYIALIAPALISGDGVEAIWLDLLEYVGADAARLGLHHLIAEASEEGEEVEVLRQAGYAVYLRRDILRLDAAHGLAPVHGALRECQDADIWAVQQLYFNTAPRLAHVAEGMPRAGPSGARGYVYYQTKGELAAYVEVRRGSQGAWINLMIHPDAESRATEIIRQVLGELGSSWDRPIFCGVRRYQEWLRRPLETLGFQAFGATVLMVKHLVAHVAAPEVVVPIDPRVEVTPT